jgi:hypothetical protein
VEEGAAFGACYRRAGRRAAAGQHTRALAAVHALVEHGFAHLKNWRAPATVLTDQVRNAATTDGAKVVQFTDWGRRQPAVANWPP